VRVSLPKPFAQYSSLTFLCLLDSYDTEIFADLIDKILVLDPKRRFTANDALDHDWFWSEPFPTEPHRSVSSFFKNFSPRRKLTLLVLRL
jgi:serine/threonine protein kinase